jgi:hypothetical protein
MLAPQKKPPCQRLLSLSHYKNSVAEVEGWTNVGELRLQGPHNPHLLISRTQG